MRNIDDAMNHQSPFRRFFDGCGHVNALRNLIEGRHILHLNRGIASMRSVWAIVACLGVALTVAACNPNEREYFRQGIGTELYTADTAAATEFLNVYLDYLCRQSESRIGPNVPSCADHVVPSNIWPLIVQAGLNDIDARCDSYLAWLDQKRRENAAILTEISAVRFAVDALTNPNVTGVSAVGLAAVSAAFGLATNTVGNFNSLLLQVDHTTVQTVVVGNRRIFREDLLKVSSSIDNKPFAVHTLRTYLSICMPMTISANINSTVTVFKQTGSAPGAGPVMPTVAAPFKARDPAPTGPVDRGGLKVKHPEFAVWFKDYDRDPAQFPISTITLLQNVMCVPDDEVGKPPGAQSTTSAHIAIFEETSAERAADAKKITADGRIDTKERDLLIGEKPCNKSAVQNYFERRLTKNGTLTDVSAIIKLLNTEKLPGLNDLPLTTSLNDARVRIALVRQSLAGKQANAGKLKDRPFSMTGQWTKDIADVLLGL